jgi:hypothetical protein
VSTEWEPHISLTGLLNTGPPHLTPSTACSGDAAPVISSRRWRDHRMVNAVTTER